MKNLEREFDIQKTPDYGGSFGAEKSPGDEAEEGILEFFGDVFACARYLKQTKKYGENDKHGIDGVALLEDEDGNKFLLALESSGPDKIRKGEKTRQQKREPMVFVEEERDSRGNILIEATDEKIPRLRIGYNLNYILALVHEARENGLRVAENLNKNNRRKELVALKKNILSSFF